LQRFQAHFCWLGPIAIWKHHTMPECFQLLVIWLACDQDTILFGVVILWMSQLVS
jgi:hypothetical protein